MWKPGQLVTINHKVYRVTKVKIEPTKPPRYTLMCMCCDIKRGTDFCSENCVKIPFFCYLKLV